MPTIAACHAAISAGLQRAHIWSPLLVLPRLSSHSNPDKSIPYFFYSLANDRPSRKWARKLKHQSCEYQGLSEGSNNVFQCESHPHTYKILQANIADIEKVSAHREVQVHKHHLRSSSAHQNVLRPGQPWASTRVALGLTVSEVEAQGCQITHTHKLSYTKLNKHLESHHTAARYASCFFRLRSTERSRESSHSLSQNRSSVSSYTRSLCHVFHNSCKAKWFSLPCCIPLKPFGFTALSIKAA